MDPLDNRSIESAISFVNDGAVDIHVWMNIVGGFAMGNHVEETNGTCNYVYNTNFLTALNCCQRILPKMKYMDWGRIINMGSQSATGCMPLEGLIVPAKQQFIP